MIPIDQTNHADQPARPNRHKRTLFRPWSRERDPQHFVKMELRKRSDDKYHSGRWTKESKAYRAEHPLCAMCQERGDITPTEVVDHIIPSQVCEDFWDQNNWQPLCRACNKLKGRTLDKKVIRKANRLKDNE